jgi:hypothetical protein
MSTNERKFSLAGSVSLGTGVMIGAGIFALVCQVAGFAGDWFPLAFVAGSFTLFMYVSMVVAESLLARTFGAYLLRPFGLQDSVILVPILGIAAIVAAAIVNLLGIAVLAIAGLVGAAVSGGGLFTEVSSDPVAPFQFLAGVALCVLAYKGFTTITNQGDDIRDAKRNIVRSILISLAICTVLYVLITLSVEASIGVQGAVDARDYALAQAAEPLFGAWGGRPDRRDRGGRDVVWPTGEPVFGIASLRDAARNEAGALASAGSSTTTVDHHSRTRDRCYCVPGPGPDRLRRRLSLPDNGYRRSVGRHPPPSQEDSCELVVASSHHHLGCGDPYPVHGAQGAVRLADCTDCRRGCKSDLPRPGDNRRPAQCR